MRFKPGASNGGTMLFSYVCFGQLSVHSLTMSIGLGDVMDKFYLIVYFTIMLVSWLSGPLSPSL